MTHVQHEYYILQQITCFCHVIVCHSFVMRVSRLSHLVTWSSATRDYGKAIIGMALQSKKVINYLIFSNSNYTMGFVDQLFMARRAIPYNCFPTGSMYVYYILVSTCASMRCIRSYVIPGGLGQLMGVARNRTRARSLQSSRKKAACRLTSLCRNWNQ